MNEYLDKIRQEIEQKKSDIMAKLDSFDTSMLDNINSNISVAKNIIDELTNNNEIDFSIIPSILDSMPQYRLGEMVVGDSDTYQKIYEMLKDMKKDNEEIPGFFDDDIEKYSKVFTNLADEIKHFITNKRKEYNEITSQKRELASKLKEIRSIGIIIDKYSHEQVILSDEIQKLYTYLINENELLDLEEKFDFYRTFSQINTERISVKLNERVIENVEEQALAPAEEATNEDFQMIQLENLVEQINNVDNSDNQDIVEDNTENNENSEQLISEDRLSELIGEENLTLYKSVKHLIEQYKSQMENIEITSLIPINNGTERRRAYEVYIYEDFAQAKKFIFDDIENKILFEINKDLNDGVFSEESFEELKFAYNEFEKVVNMEKEKIAKKKLKEKKEKTNYMDILVELQMKNAIDLCNKIESLLIECSIRAKNETIFRNAINQYSLNLNASYEEFIDALKDYYFEKDDDDLKEIFFDIAFPNLVQTYDDFLSVYNMYTISGDLNDEYVDSALDFYGRYNNINQILLVSDDSGISYIEDDINNSREITRKTQALSNVVHKLGLFADNDEYEIESGHDVKTKNFSEEIKKEFQIRSSSCGSDLRIFYSKFSTKLNEIFPEKYDKIPSIIFIYEVAYGATDGEKKNAINQKAYKRCYERREELRNIKKLFNTDISNCTEAEKQSIRKQIQDNIREQNIKLGHLIVEEGNIKENEKRIGGVE